MTTPAINAVQSLNGQAFRDTWSGGHSLVSDHLQQQFTEQRPASVTSSRLGKFKLCESYFHSGKKWAVADDSVGFHIPGLPSFWVKDTGNIYDPGFPDAEIPSSNLSNMSLVKALENLKHQDIHVGNFVAESHKTLDMFAENARRIASITSSFRRNKPKLWDKVKQLEGSLPRSRWCEIPGLWLEYQYGWRPLMSDIFGAVHHLAKRNRFTIPYVTVKGSAKTSTTTVSSCSDTAGNTYELEFEHKQSVNTFLTYSLSNPHLAELSSLGLVNPAEIVWETTRYSFVVDWFLPIGSWLSSLTASAGYQFITGGQSKVSRCTFSSSRLSALTPSWDIDFHGLPKLTGAGRYFARSCFGGDPFPGLYVKNPLSFDHVANALSLLVQAFR